MPSLLRMSAPDCCSPRDLQRVAHHRCRPGRVEVVPPARAPASHSFSFDGKVSAADGREAVRHRAASRVHPNGWVVSLPTMDVENARMHLGCDAVDFRQAIGAAIGVEEYDMTPDYARD